MILIGITNMHEGAEALAPRLSQALGLTLHEGLMRLRGAGAGPIVISAHQDGDPAKAMAKTLSEAGFTVVVAHGKDFAKETTALMVRRFALEPDGFMAEAAGGERLVVPSDQFQLILRATGITSHDEQKTTTEKKFSAGMAIATQGLVTTTKVKKTTVTTVQEREGFFHVYTAGGRVIEFRETRVDYNSLGESKQPTRMLNFARIIQELRTFAPGALYDERLLTRNAQAQLLGPMLNPESHIMHACALLAKTLIAARQTPPG